MKLHDFAVTIPDKTNSDENHKKRFCRFLIFSFFKNFAPIDYWGGREGGGLNFSQFGPDLKKILYDLKPWKKRGIYIGVPSCK